MEEKTYCIDPPYTAPSDSSRRAWPVRAAYDLGSRCPCRCLLAGRMRIARREFSARNPSRGQRWRGSAGTRRRAQGRRRRGRARLGFWFRSCHGLSPLCGRGIGVQSPWLDKRKAFGGGQCCGCGEGGIILLRKVVRGLGIGQARAGGAWPFPPPDLEGILEYHCHDGKTGRDLRVIHITGL